MATDESNSRNEIWHWKKDELEVAVQSWIHELIEQMIRASGTKFSGGVFKFHHSRQLSIATSKNHSVVNTI